MSLVGVVAFGNTRVNVGILLKACRLIRCFFLTSYRCFDGFGGYYIAFNIATSLTNYFETGQLF